MWQYIFRFFIGFSGILLFYLLLRKPWKRKSREGLLRELAVGLFAAYVAALMMLALEGEYREPFEMFSKAAERIASKEGINMVPLRTIRNLFLYFQADIFMVNIVGNIVMFMPWGFGLALLRKGRPGLVYIAICSLLFPLFIETMQLFIGRSVDVDDVILNFIGGCMGAVLYFCKPCLALRRKD